MDKACLTGDEVVKIIDACAKKGVSVLKFGALELQLHAPEHRTSKISARGVPPLPEAAKSDQKIEEMQQVVSRETLELEEIRTREDQIAELLVTDPYQAERLMELGELEPNSEEEEHELRDY